MSYNKQKKIADTFTNVGIYIVTAFALGIVLNNNINQSLLLAVVAGLWGFLLITVGIMLTPEKKDETKTPTEITIKKGIIHIKDYDKTKD